MSGHTHTHSHAPAAARFRTALALTAVILVVEVVAGIGAHSLALLSDAGHVFTDVAALGLAWYATAQALRPADATKTFGYHRIGILAALANALTLLLIVAFIIFEAVGRLQHPLPRIHRRSPPPASLQRPAPQRQPRLPRAPAPRVKPPAVTKTTSRTSPSAAQ